MNSTRPGATLDFCKVSPSSRRGSDQDVSQANCAFDVFAVELDIERRGACATPVAGQTTQAQSLQEEMRQIRHLMEQMRKLIERQESRIRRLEAEKSASAAKPASTTDNAAPARKDTSPATPGSGQANPPGATLKDTSNQTQPSTHASDQSQVYRHVWQAYGTYAAPLGKGLWW